MDDEEELLTGRKKSRRLAVISVVVAAVLIFGGVAAYMYLDYAEAEREEDLVEQVTGAAFGCVASVRGDAPESWGLERSLEHMSRMERITRDADDPTRRDEQQRFATLSADAAAGCQELGELMREAHAEDSSLYFGVPAPLAQMPDQADPERWFRRILPKSRDEVVELTRQIQLMADAINARRAERSLMNQELPISGDAASELAQIVELGSMPRDRERTRTEVWPMPEAITVIRRASIPHVVCDTRHINRLSCFNEFVQTVGWEGAVSSPRELERPRRVDYWAALAPGTDGSIWAVGLDRHNDGIVGRYPPLETEPELRSIDIEVDATTNIVPVARGIAIFPSDGNAWVSTLDELAFEQVDTTPPPIVLNTGSGGPDRGIELEHIGRLSLDGSEDDGFTSRLERPNGEDVLLRVIDANVRVQRIDSLRALRSGKAVAALQRQGDHPDALVITPDFGESWFAGNRGGVTVEPADEDSAE